MYMYPYMCLVSLFLAEGVFNQAEIVVQGFVYQCPILERGKKIQLTAEASSTSVWVSASASAQEKGAAAWSVPVMNGQT